MNMDDLFELELKIAQLDERLCAVELLIHQIVNGMKQYLKDSNAPTQT